MMQHSKHIYFVTEKHWILSGEIIFNLFKHFKIKIICNNIFYLLYLMQQTFNYFLNSTQNVKYFEEFLERK